MNTVTAWIGKSDRNCGYEDPVEIDATYENWRERHESVLMAHGSTRGTYCDSQYGTTKITGVIDRKFVFAHEEK
jgi:hypothetical protein